MMPGEVPDLWRDYSDRVGALALMPAWCGKALFDSYNDYILLIWTK